MNLKIFFSWNGLIGFGGKCKILNFRRAIGLFFIVPGAYFAYKGYMTRRLSQRSLLLGGLIGTQGILGWLMVKSGLDLELISQNAHPRVSHYWLAAHLGSAFVIYSGLFLTGLEILSVIFLKLNQRKLSPIQYMISN